MSQLISKLSNSQELHNMVQYPDTQEYQIEVLKLHNIVQYENIRFCYKIRISIEIESRLYYNIPLLI